MNVKAIEVTGDADPVHPGEYCIVVHGDSAGELSGQVAGIDFVCPCGCGKVGWLAFNGPAPTWNWNGWTGNEAITLTPSVLQKSGCKWHGFLTAGEWVSC